MHARRPNSSGRLEALRRKGVAATSSAGPGQLEPEGTAFAGLGFHTDAAVHAFGHFGNLTYCISWSRTKATRLEGKYSTAILLMQTVTCVHLRSLSLY